jgi:hypothetical protein
MFFSCPAILPMVPCVLQSLANVQQQRAGATGKVEHAVQMLFRPRGGFLAVQRDDARQDAGNLLRRVELARLLAGAGGKLADQVFIGVAQRVLVGGELRQPLGNRLDDGAELGITRFIALAQLFRIQIDLGKQPAEGAGEGFVLDIVEALLQGVQQFPVCVRAISEMLPHR